jgi:predicted SnoaL-like aldol condensation-catalyzing enzyme
MNAFESGSYSLRPHKSSAQTFSLDPYLETDLPPGKYRLVKFFGELFDSKPDAEKIKSYSWSLLK